MLKNIKRLRFFILYNVFLIFIYWKVNFVNKNIFMIFCRKTFKGLFWVRYCWGVYIVSKKFFLF